MRGGEDVRRRPFYSRFFKGKDVFTSQVDKYNLPVCYWTFIICITWLCVRKVASGHANCGWQARWSSALSATRAILQEQLESIQQAGTLKRERVITSMQAVSVQVQGRNQPLLNFCANNYLGLSVCWSMMRHIYKQNNSWALTLSIFSVVANSQRVIRKSSRLPRMRLRITERDWVRYVSYVAPKIFTRWVYYISI